jgi:histidyl-tRNA synthetase
MKISNQPPKGTADWLPDEFAIRKYIFDTWRDVCVRFGYREYLTPIIESAEVYRAKSGEDVGVRELMTMTDQGGRELAIRPEMTPSVTRMVTRIYESSPKPLRLFSIANFLRNEKPQRGRNREFWQLNYDVFGSDSFAADVEVLQIALEIMLAFNPPAGSFTMNINNRKLIDTVLNELVKVPSENRADVVRILDKWEKLSPTDIYDRLETIGLSEEQIETLKKFMASESVEMLLVNLPKLKNNPDVDATVAVIGDLNELGYGNWIKFRPNIIRGFDYYDGIVFEVFDNNPENKRSMFGGGRYNGLAGIFGSQSFPAVGCAPGDETTRLFLESWGLLEQIKLKQSQPRYYLPLLAEDLAIPVQKLAQKLRNEGNIVEAGIEVQKLGKSLEYANKGGIGYVVILGSDEFAAGSYQVKNMLSGESTTLPL